MPTRRRASSSRARSGAAARLIRRNVDVLMDRAPAGAEEAARQAIERIDPPVELRRLRMRPRPGKHFADVVIGVSPGAAVGQGHAAADEVEEAPCGALPETDVVVHVEPPQARRPCATALAAASVPRVREVHNLSVLGGRRWHRALAAPQAPGRLTLDEAHAVAEEVERAISAAVPEARRVQTHLEPIPDDAGRARGRAGTDGRRSSASSRRRPAPAARAALPAHRRGPRRVPHAGRGRRTPCSPTRTRTRARSRSGSARARRHRRRRGPHGAVKLCVASHDCQRCDRSFGRDRRRPADLEVAAARRRLRGSALHVHPGTAT